jgi:hypothetical protein
MPKVSLCILGCAALLLGCDSEDRYTDHPDATPTVVPESRPDTTGGVAGPGDGAGQYQTPPRQQVPATTPTPDGQAQ